MPNRKIISKSPLAILLVIMSVYIGQNYLAFIINITPSVPKGIYIKTHGVIQQGDIVSFCLMPAYQAIGLRNAYLVAGSTCHGADPMIKKVIARPGDNVVLSDEFIKVNGIHYKYKTAYVDSAGKKLSAYPRGNYTNTAGYWLIGSNHPNSWDSRYWGPIDSKQIISKLRPWVTW